MLLKTRIRFKQTTNFMPKPLRNLRMTCFALQNFAIITFSSTIWAVKITAPDLSSQTAVMRHDSEHHSLPDFRLRVLELLRHMTFLYHSFSQWQNVLAT